MAICPKVSGEKRVGEQIRMPSHYLDQPFIPLAVALPRMLADIEAKMAAAAPPEKSRLQNQAEIFRQWLNDAATCGEPKG